MTCQQVKDSLGSYVYGELPPPESSALESHVHACQGCREELEAEKRLVQVLAERLRGTAEEVAR